MKVKTTDEQAIQIATKMRTQTHTLGESDMKDAYFWREFDTEEEAVAFNEELNMEAGVSDVELRCQPLKPHHWIVTWWHTPTDALTYSDDDSPQWEDD